MDCLVFLNIMCYIFKTISVIEHIWYRIIFHLTNIPWSIFQIVTGDKISSIFCVLKKNALLDMLVIRFSGCHYRIKSPTGNVWRRLVWTIKLALFPFSFLVRNISLYIWSYFTGYMIRLWENYGWTNLSILVLLRLFFQP